MQEKVASILFADIMNSSEYANVMSTSNYHNFMIKTLKAICEDEENYFISLHPEYRPLSAKGDKKNEEFNCQFIAAGDEIRVFLYSGDEWADTNHLMEIAIRLKLRWLFCEFNKTRVKQNKSPEELAIGLNTGPVIIEENLPEGFAINVGKRIEGECRNGTHCRILFHSKSANYIQSYQKRKNANFFITPHFTAGWTFSGKGISQQIPIKELLYFTFEGQAEVLRMLDIDPKVFFKHLFAAASMAPYPHFIYSTILSALQKLGIDDYTSNYLEEISSKVYQYMKHDEILDVIIQIYEYRYANGFKTMSSKAKVGFLHDFFRWAKKDRFQYRYLLEDIQREQHKLQSGFRHLPKI